MKTIAVAGRVAGLIAAAMAAILTLLTVSDICGRFFFSRPILGTTEISEYMLAVMAFFSIAWTAVNHHHIKVDLVMSNFSPRVQAIVDSVTTILSIGIYAVITWRLVMEGLDLLQLNMTSKFLGIPKYPFYFVASLGAALLTLAAVTNLIQYIEKARGLKQ